MDTVQDALDLAAMIRYEGGAACAAVDKWSVAENFVILSRGLAGEILQKLTNYQVKLAIYGDFSRCTSKPLQDFIRESNRGRDFFFTEDPGETVERLAKAGIRAKARARPMDASSFCRPAGLQRLL